MMFVDAAAAAARGAAHLLVEEPAVGDALATVARRDAREFIMGIRRRFRTVETGKASPRESFSSKCDKAEKK